MTETNVKLTVLAAELRVNLGELMSWLGARGEAPRSASGDVTSAAASEARLHFNKGAAQAAPTGLAATRAAIAAASQAAANQMAANRAAAQAALVANRPAGAPLPAVGGPGGGPGAAPRVFGAPAPGAAGAVRGAVAGRGGPRFGPPGRGGRRRPPVRTRRRGRELDEPEPVTLGPSLVQRDGVYPLPPALSVKELGDYISVTAIDIIKVLMRNGVMANVNQTLSYDEAAIVALDLGVQVEPMDVEQFSEVPGEADGAANGAVKTASRSELLSTLHDDPATLQPRSPVVTVMGHVDHGKTSLLDAIRETKVTAGEAGGITQRIGAYVVEKSGRRIVFIDTPGHEAFTAMRARGAQVTDLAVLVVAADDGVMPQTIEAIQHAKAAGVPMVVAINKIDKDNANPDRVKQELSAHGVVIEEYGGDTPAVLVSARNKTGLEDLLEIILLVAEIGEHKANPDKLGVGTVIDAQLERGRGPVATVLVQNGTVSVGDDFVVGHIFGRIRALIDDRGRRVKKAGPATPVLVTGLSDVPQAGDIFQSVASEKVARAAAQQRLELKRAQEQLGTRSVTLDNLFAKIKEGELKELNLVLKADTPGALQALKQQIEKIEDAEVRVRIVASTVGAITESDVLLASDSSALVIGYNTKPSPEAQAKADVEKVDVRHYEVIYNLIADIQAAIQGLYEPTYERVHEGRAEVRVPIRVPKIGFIAGSMVTEGRVSRADLVEVMREGQLVWEGKIASLKRFKDDVKEVLEGFECGIELEGFQDIQVGDLLEIYRLERTN